MAADSLLTAPSAMVGRRFFLASYLPTASATLFVLVIVWAGARGWRPARRHRLDFTAAWNTGAHLGAAEILGLALLIALLSFLLSPLQTRLVQLLSVRRPRGWQARRRGKLRDRAVIAFSSTPPSAATVQRAGMAGYELRRRFPPAEDDEALRATAFGNALEAGADRAGRPYGLDTATAWPRLYPVLGDQVRAVVDDRRDVMDASARTVVTMAGTAVISLILLLDTGRWLALVAIPVGLALLAYQAAVQAALAYVDAVCVAFDLHHLDLLAALHIQIPDTAPQQQRALAALSDLWRQGIPLPQSVPRAVTFRKDS